MQRTEILNICMKDVINLIAVLEDLLALSIVKTVSEFDRTIEYCGQF